MSYSRKLIEDEFTDAPYTRQRKQQLRWRAQGRCQKCGNPELAWSKLGTRKISICHSCKIKQQAYYSKLRQS